MMRFVQCPSGRTKTRVLAYRTIRRQIHRLRAQNCFNKSKQETHGKRWIMNCENKSLGRWDFIVSFIRSKSRLHFSRWFSYEIFHSWFFFLALFFSLAIQTMCCIHSIGSNSEIAFKDKQKIIYLIRLFLLFFGCFHLAQIVKCSPTNRFRMSRHRRHCVDVEIIRKNNMDDVII